MPFSDLWRTLQSYREKTSIKFNRCLYTSLYLDKLDTSARSIYQTSSIFVTVYGLRWNSFRAGLCKLYVFWHFLSVQPRSKNIPLALFITWYTKIFGIFIFIFRGFQLPAYITRLSTIANWLAVKIKAFVIFITLRIQKFPTTVILVDCFPCIDCWYSCTKQRVCHSSLYGHEDRFISNIHNFSRSTRYISYNIIIFSFRIKQELQFLNRFEMTVKNALSGDSPS